MVFNICGTPVNFRVVCTSFKKLFSIYGWIKSFTTDNKNHLKMNMKQKIFSINLAENECHKRSVLKIEFKIRKANAILYNGTND